MENRNPARYPQDPVNPQLITDFTAYDTGQSVRKSRGTLAPNPFKFGLHWVGDLAVSATAELENKSGQVVLELIKGGRKFQCRLDAATGNATLSISGEDMQIVPSNCADKIYRAGQIRPDVFQLRSGIVALD